MSVEEFAKKHLGKNVSWNTGSSVNGGLGRVLGYTPPAGMLYDGSVIIGVIKTDGFKGWDRLKLYSPVLMMNDPSISLYVLKAPTNMTLIDIDTITQSYPVLKPAATTNAKPTISHYPDKCSRCGSPAYNRMYGGVDCSRGCK